MATQAKQLPSFIVQAGLSVRLGSVSSISFHSSGAGEDSITEILDVSSHYGELGFFFGEKCPCALAERQLAPRGSRSLKHSLNTGMMQNE